MTELLTTAHAPTAECHWAHCYAHDRDEPDVGYRSCWECGHSYMTRRELRREWRAGYPPPASLRDWVRMVWQCLTVRVVKVHFCPLCMHDWATVS